VNDWSLASVASRVRAALAGALPGLDAQRLMAPVPRVGWRPADLPADARLAAALLLLYEEHGVTTLALTVRASHLPQHAGQVCLPGGAQEPGEPLEDTALRETAEEVGIEAAEVTVVGRLTPLHIPVSGFVLHPVVAVASAPPVFSPAPHEVARVLQVALPALCDPLAVRVRMRRHDGQDFEVPYFLLDGEVVWGATAMVLAEFLAILGHAPFGGRRETGSNAREPASDRAG
jgi:8-oxo-dGTP pyrophosphatase MutT (NUDIX family)